MTSNFNLSLLISEVKNRPALWKKDYSLYKNAKYKTRLWIEIKETAFPDHETEELKKKWNNARSYYKALKTPRTTGEEAEAGEEVTSWAHFDEIDAFLAPYVDDSKNRDSNLTKNKPTPPALSPSTFSSSGDDGGDGDDDDDESRTPFVMPKPPEIDPVLLRGEIRASKSDMITPKSLVSEKKVKKRRRESEEVVDTERVIKSSVELAAKALTQEDDEETIFGHLVAKMMKKVPEFARGQVQLEVQQLILKAQREYGGIAGTHLTAGTSQLSAVHAHNTISSAASSEMGTYPTMGNIQANFREITDPNLM